jgi:hypothetical protein
MHRRWNVGIALGLTLAVFCSVEASAQPALVIARSLTLPADAMCKAAKGNPITLRELAASIEKNYRIKVTVAYEGFQAADPKIDWNTARVTLPVKPGLRLATVLHYVLENDLTVRATIKIAGDTLIILPGATEVVQDEVRDGPVGKRLNATVMAVKNNAGGSMQEALSVIEKQTGIPILVSSRKFVEAKNLDFMSANVTLKKQAKVPAVTFLRDVLNQGKASYHVKPDHILVVPKGK